MIRPSKCAMAVALSLATLSVSSAADARSRYRGPVCHGPFQDSVYGPISTPLCQDLQIARVARSYGYRVSDDEVRYNDLTKIKLCFAIGYDTRLKESCAAHRPGRGGR